MGRCPPLEKPDHVLLPQVQVFGVQPGFTRPHHMLYAVIDEQRARRCRAVP